MRHDTFTIHAVGIYTSVETQETHKKRQRHVIVMPVCLWSLRQARIPMPIGPFLEMGPFLETGPFLDRSPPISGFRQVMCCEPQILLCAPLG